MNRHGLLQRTRSKDKLITSVPLFQGRGPVSITGQNVPPKIASAVDVALRDKAKRYGILAVKLRWAVMPATQGNIAIHVYDPTPIEVTT